MMRSSIQNPKKLRRLLLLLIFLSMGGIIFLFMGDRFFGNDSGDKKSVTPKASLALDKIEQTSTRDGVKQWTLTAKSAKYFREDRKAVFDELSVTFFLEKGEEAHLSAREGILDTETNDMTARGKVTVTRDTNEIATETLHYNHDERIFHSDVAVTITADSMVVTASSMNHNLNTGKTLLQGDVKGLFDEMFEF